MRLGFPQSLITLALFLTMLLFSTSQTSRAQSNIYSNLERSRDALLSQQAELQKAYDDTRKQIDNLNGRLNRIDSYLRQINSALKDVEDVMRTAR